MLFMLQRDALNLEPSNVANCVSKGKSEVSFGMILFHFSNVNDGTMIAT